MFPAIYGDIVVWEDSRNGNKDICGYRISTNQEFQITSNNSDQMFPAIYGDTIIWEDSRNDNTDIYGYNLSIEEEFQITTNPSPQMHPDIYGSIIVWLDITGPSGAGKSTLRDYYCKKRSIASISALTTRPSRKEEKEIQRTIKIDCFRKLADEGRLCLISENHGHLYGYLCEDIKKTKSEIVIIEIDSKTAVREKENFQAVIIRVIPCSARIALAKILTKRDGINAVLSRQKNSQKGSSCPLKTISRTEATRLQVSSVAA